MRCLRAITDERLTASVFLSKDNYDILDSELHKNFNMEISDLSDKKKEPSIPCKVRVLPPPRTIILKRIWREYTLVEKQYETPIDFNLQEADFSKYESKVYERGSLVSDWTIKEKVIDDIKDKVKYNEILLVSEISRYLNISCLLVSKILKESVDGIDFILECVNKYNEVIYDNIVPNIFAALYEIQVERKTEDKELVLLREPENKGYYEFNGKADLIKTIHSKDIYEEQKAKSFHADTYCFDSKPEKELFMQYISDTRVKEIYFTGMFTSGQGDLVVNYYDPESGRIRKYYPDFLAKMADGSYQIIEVKGDNKIDDIVVKAKSQAAEEMAVASGVKYIIYPGSKILKSMVLDEYFSSLPQKTNLLNE